VDDASDTEDSEGNESEDAEPEGTESENPEVKLRRGPGRPRRKVLTGQRGRPRTEYNMVGPTNEESTSEETDTVFLAEYLMSKALSTPESDEWMRAMASEVKSLLQNRTWEIVKRPKGHSVIGSRFVLQNKYGTNGVLEKRKARVVARGFSQ